MKIVKTEFGWRKPNLIERWFDWFDEHQIIGGTILFSLLDVVVLLLNTW